MNNFYKRPFPGLLLTLSAVLMTFALQAQVSSNYSFTSSQGTYTEITGGTVIATATTTTGNTALDNVVYTLAAGTIPFNFNFDGTNYTGCRVSTNGFITFGNVAPALSGTTTGYVPLSAATAYSGAISAFGRNLAAYFFAGNPAQTGELRYQVLGSAPNRIFVIQFKNFKPFNYSTTVFSSPMNFQIRLRETSNIIDIVYKITGTYSASILGEVGLRGPNNIYPSNINNRRVATGVSTWPASLAGTANNSTCEIFNALVPASGLTYTWSPASCSPPVGLGVTEVTTSAAELFWSATGGGTFKVEYGAQGFTPGTGTVVNNAVSPLTVTGLLPSTNYAFYVQHLCGASGNSVNTGPFNFTTGGAGEFCGNAININVAASLANCNYTVVNSGVSQNGPNGNCSDGVGNVANDDRWYKFVAPANGKKIVITTTAGTVNDWVLQVWSSCNLSPTDLIKCADDVNGTMPQVTLCQNEYVAGNTYYIRAWTYSQNATGTMNMCVYEDTPCIIAPLNDECISATRLTVANSTGCPAGAATFTDLNATASGDAASCDANTKNDVWFVFNTASWGDLRVTFTKGTATNLKAQLLFECGGMEIACWSPADGTPKILSGLNPSADYILRVWSNAGTAGTFSICIQDVCADPTAVLSGSTTLCQGNTANMLVHFTGTPPYSFMYTDGTVNTTLSGINSNPYILQAAPATTRTYSLVSMSDGACAGTVSGFATINVATAPTVTLNPFAPVCSNAGLITLTGGSPAGGTYSGNGVSGTTFNPAVGTSMITYTVTYGPGCLKSASQQIVVNTAQVVTLNTFPSVCSSASPFTLTGGMPGGGTYSGPGITNNIFSPSVAGVGVKIITYTVNSGGCSGSDTATITVNNCGSCPNPPTANAGVDKSSCGTAAVSVTGTRGGGATSSTWTRIGSGTISNPSALSITYTPSAADISNGSATLILTTNDPDGTGPCVAASDAMVITFSSGPVAGTISGYSNFCRNTSGNIYSVAAQPGVTFTWTVPAGATISSGQGTNSISVAFNSAAVTGNVCVTPSNGCGSGAQVCKTITVRTAVPSTPGTISGSNNGCPGETKTYSIAAIATANQYLWTPPAGATVNGSTSAITTTSTTVSVTFGAGFTGDTLKVRALNCIGQSGQRTLRINRNAPSTPGTITGAATTGLCNRSGIAFSIAAVNNAVSYTWRTNIVGATINGSSTPVTTTSLSVTMNFTTFNNGQIYVKANNGCGSSTERSLTVYGRPAPPTSMTGLASVCKGQNGVAYSTPAIPFATSYGWTVPTGSTIAGGQNTTAITVNYGASAVSGQVRVRSTNACGSSAYFVKAVTVSSCADRMDETAFSGIVLEAYPNPASDNVTVSLNSVKEGKYNITLTDLAGRSVYQHSLKAAEGMNEFRIELSHFAEGAYILKAVSDTESAQVRIIVE